MIFRYFLLKAKELKVCTNRSSSLPRKTLLLKHSATVTLNSVTLTSHHVRGAGSGMCELTNQSRLGFLKTGIKDTVTKTEHFRWRENKTFSEQ